MSVSGPPPSQVGAALLSSESQRRHEARTRVEYDTAQLIERGSPSFDWILYGDDGRLIEQTIVRQRRRHDVLILFLVFMMTTALVVGGLFVWHEHAMQQTEAVAMGYHDVVTDSV